MISKADLLKQARNFHYKPDILEKVFKLLEVLEAFVSIPFLRDRLVLKGGTALNLFYFEHLPRLSVDIDLNYIGCLDRVVMLEERVTINETIYQILSQKGFTPDRNPTAYAGGKMVWRYDSLLGQKGNLEIDLNYMYRQPLLDNEWKHPNIGSDQIPKIPILDIHELAAGKLTALFARQASRDLFDAHYLLTKNFLSLDKLRPIWVAYLSMSDVPIDMLSPEYINYDLKSVNNELLPVLKQNHGLGKRMELEKWLQQTLLELREKLSHLLPLSASDLDFIEKIRAEGVIDSKLITTDRLFGERLQTHPAILWAASKKPNLI